MKSVNVIFARISMSGKLDISLCKIMLFQKWQRFRYSIIESFKNLHFYYNGLILYPILCFYENMENRKFNAQNILNTATLKTNKWLSWLDDGYDMQSRCIIDSRIVVVYSFCIHVKNWRNSAACAILYFWMDKEIKIYYFSILNKLTNLRTSYHNIVTLYLKYRPPHSFYSLFCHLNLT